TGTEAGAVGAFAALVIAIIARRSSDKSLPQLLIASAREAIEVTSMIFMLLIGGAVFTFFIVSAGLPITVTEWILGLPVDPNIVLALFLLAIIPLGMFLDGLSILLFTVPIMAPVVVQSGFDGVWFGVLVVKTIEMGLITPPVGINVFIISGLVPDLRVEHVFRRVGPFVALDLAVTALFFLVPGIVTWLPRAAGL
ncbi:MAG TPA: TRAP transporter large permease subunit, partial [Egibacteraceae bacterium]|nr:TRAP transporter large permease subunit [Egibacteraceae bacterium]